MAVGGEGLQADAHQAVAAQALDGLVGVRLLRQGFTQQAQQQVERCALQWTVGRQLGQPLHLPGGQALAGHFDLPGLLRQLSGDVLTGDGAVLHGRGDTARRGFPEFAQARLDGQRWGLVPRRAGGQRRIGRHAHRQVPRRVQRESGTGQPVALGVVFAVDEPAGQQAEVGGAVAAPAAALVEGGDGAEQLRDRRPGTGAQQFRLRGCVAMAQEPAPQTSPAALPDLVAREAIGGQIGRCIGCRVPGFARGHGLQQRLDVRLQRAQVGGDRARAPHQVAQEALQVVDQALLVLHHRGGVRLAQVELTGHAGHEVLRVAGHLLEALGEVTQRLVDLGGIEPGPLLAFLCAPFGREPTQRLQPHRDVFERYRLQLRPALQAGGENVQCSFDRLAASRQAVQKTGPVVVAQAGHARHVGLGLQVPPGRQLCQRRLDVLDAWQRPRSPVTLREHLVRAQLELVLAQGGGEHGQDAPVEVGLVGAEVAEQVVVGSREHGGAILHDNSNDVIVLR